MILCGLPRCGKTTLGKRLAKMMNWRFIDTDLLLEKPARELFQQKGEKAFRAIEKTCVFSLKENKQCVIALGGGGLLDPENCAFLKQLGLIVYLKSDPEKTWERGAPCFIQDKASFLKMAKERIPLYEKTAELVVEV